MHCFGWFVHHFLWHSLNVFEWNESYLQNCNHKRRQMIWKLISIYLEKSWMFCCLNRVWRICTHLSDRISCNHEFACSDYVSMQNIKRQINKIQRDFLLFDSVEFGCAHGVVVADSTIETNFKCKTIKQDTLLRRKNKKREPVSECNIFLDHLFFFFLSSYHHSTCLFVNVNINMIQISQQHSKV